MSSCQYRRGACILATRHGSHMLQGESGPQGGDNLQPACSNCRRAQINKYTHGNLLHRGKRVYILEVILTRCLHMYMLNTRTCWCRHLPTCAQ